MIMFSLFSVLVLLHTASSSIVTPGEREMRSAMEPLRISLVPALDFHEESECCDDRLFFRVSWPQSDSFCYKRCNETDVSECAGVCGGTIPSIALSDYPSIEFAFEAPNGKEIQIISNPDTFEIVIEFQAVADCHYDAFVELNGHHFLDGGIVGSASEQLMDSFAPDRSFIKLGRCPDCDDKCKISTRVVLNGNGTGLFGSVSRLWWSVQYDGTLWNETHDYYYGTDTNSTIYTPHHDAIVPVPIGISDHDMLEDGEPSLPPDNDIGVGEDGLWIELVPAPEFHYETGCCDDLLHFDVESPHTYISCEKDCDGTATNGSCNVTCGGVIGSLDLSLYDKIGFVFNSPEGQEIMIDSVSGTSVVVEFHALAECNMSSFVELNGHYFEGGVFGSQVDGLSEVFDPEKSFVKLGRCPGCEKCEISSRLEFNGSGSAIKGSIQNISWCIQYDSSIFTQPSTALDYHYGTGTSTWIRTPHDGISLVPTMADIDSLPCEDREGQVADEHPLVLVLAPALDFYEETGCCEDILYFRVIYPESDTTCEKQCEGTDANDCDVICGGLVPAVDLNEHNQVAFVFKAPEGKEIRIESDAETSQVRVEFQALAECDLDEYLVFDGTTFDGGIWGSDVDVLVESFVVEKSFVQLGRCPACDKCEIFSRIEFDGNGTAIQGSLSKIAWAVEYGNGVFKTDGSGALDYRYGTDTYSWIRTPRQNAIVPAPEVDDDGPQIKFPPEKVVMDERTLNFVLIPAPEFHEETECCDDLIYFRVAEPQSNHSCSQRCSASDPINCSIVCGGIIPSLDLSDYDRLQFSLVAPEGHEIPIFSGVENYRVRVEFQALAECTAPGFVTLDGHTFDGGVFGSMPDQLIDSFAPASSFVTVGGCHGCTTCEIFTRVELNGEGAAISGSVSKLLWSVEFDGSIFASTGKLDFHYGTDTSSWIRTPFHKVFFPASTPDNGIEI